MTDKQPILTCRGLMKRYGTVVAMNGADFDLYPGEITGVICAFGGWIAIGRVGSISPIGFETANLDSITAVVIGGTSLFGGRGSIPGSVLGALIVGVFSTGLSVAARVDDYWQTFAAGCLVLVAVALDQWLRRASK